jgi:protein gp37
MQPSMAATYPIGFAPLFHHQRLGAPKNTPVPQAAQSDARWRRVFVDEQKRVRLAEEAFRNIGGVRVKWLSLEPLLAPLEFSDLSMFDWIVIGSQTATKQPDGVVPAFAPPFEWVARIVAQAREAGCRVYLKPNLLGDCHPQSPGMSLPQEEPAPLGATLDAIDGAAP